MSIIRFMKKKLERVNEFNQFNQFKNGGQQDKLVLCHLNHPLMQAMSKQ